MCKSQFLDGQTEKKTLNLGVEVHYRNTYDIKFSE